ncbi:MAG: hypothetical protein GX482_06880 [Acholeplasmataceae bacterium]|nr:hypothetical protein [Acholeplasmataceae bacterium]
MKVLEFLKLFVFPTKMVRFRNMSALISLLIFVLSTYLLSLPLGKALADGVRAEKKAYNFQAVHEAAEHLDEAGKEILDEIINLECAIGEDGLLACVNLETNFKEYEIVYEKDGIKKHIHVFFDFYDQEKEEEPAIDLEKEFSIENEKYEYVENEEHYFIVFTKKYLYFQAHQLEMGDKEKDMEITHNEERLVLFRDDGLDYAKFMPGFSLKLEDGDEFGDYVIDMYLGGLSEYYRPMSFIITFLVSIVFLLLMVLLFWLFFRKTGRLQRFKEYFNTAAIASIIPLLLTFGLAWIFPIILNYYIFIFSLFYLFALFRINNMPKEE